MLRVEDAGQPLERPCWLVVAADGARSVVREQAGIAAEHWDYEQTAITTTMTTQRFHDHVAYERFTPDGPIAVLPLADGRCGVVWTRRTQDAARVLALSDEAFLGEFQSAFGFRLGRFLQVGARHSYELAMSRSERHVGPAPRDRGRRRRRACTRSPDRDSTSGCATRPVSPR